MKTKSHFSIKEVRLVGDRMKAGITVYPRIGIFNIKKYAVRKSASDVREAFKRASERQSADHSR